MNIRTQVSLQKKQEIAVAVAAEHVSKAEVASYKHALIQAKVEDLEELTDSKLRLLIAKNRWLNPICHGCMNNRKGTAFFPCDKCYLVFYCTEMCRYYHVLKGHFKTCCNPDAPLDVNCPYRPVIVDIGENPTYKDGIQCKVGEFVDINKELKKQ
jgi:hypothetical protein